MPIVPLQIKYKAGVARMSAATAGFSLRRRSRTWLGRERSNLRMVEPGICSLSPGPEMGGRSLFLDHGFQVGTVQRRWRLAAVEHDAHGAEVLTRADDDALSAGEIWTSRRAERAHPDACQARQRRPLIGRVWLGWCLGPRTIAAHPCGPTRWQSHTTRRSRAPGQSAGPARPVHCSAA